MIENAYFTFAVGPKLTNEAVVLMKYWNRPPVIGLQVNDKPQ